MKKEKKNILASYLDPAILHESSYRLFEIIRADRASVSQLRSRVGKALESHGFRHRNMFLVALDEITTNIAEHGLHFDGRKKINVAVIVKAPQIILALSDTGSAFDPNTNEAKSPHEQFKKGADGGYGMFIFKRVFHRIDYASRGDRNFLTAWFDDERLSKVLAAGG